MLRIRPEEYMIKIGDIFDTEGYGVVRVADIYISPTTDERVYRVVDTGLAVCEFLVHGIELTQDRCSSSSTC